MPDATSSWVRSACASFPSASTARSSMVRAISWAFGLLLPPAPKDEDEELVSMSVRGRARGVPPLPSVMRRPMACIISSRRASASRVWYAMVVSGRQHAAEHAHSPERVT